MRNNADNARGCEGNTVRLCLPATVDNFQLASLLNPLLESRQYRICLDVSAKLAALVREFGCTDLLADIGH